MARSVLPDIIGLCRRTTSFVIFTLIIAIVIELALSVINLFISLPFPAPSYNKALVNTKSLHADIEPSFGVWHQANYKARQTGACFDAIFTTNKWGARDDNWTSTPTNIHRGLLLGDSFMEGYGVNEQDRASEIFEQKTNTKVLNLATAGHCGPTQYRLIYNAFKDSLDHDFVLVGLNLPNELEDEDISMWKNKRRYRPYLVGNYPNYELTYATVPLEQSIYGSTKTKQSLIKNLLSEYSSLYHCMTYLMEHGASAEIDLKVHSRQNHTSNSFDEESAMKVVYNMEMIQHLAGTKPVYVFFVPNLEFIQNSNNNIFTFIAQQLLQRNIQLLDIGKYLKNQNDGKLFLDCDVHWSIEGNRRIGEALGAAYQNVPSDKLSR